MDKKKVVICGSIRQSAEQILQSANIFKMLGFEVIDPINFNRDHEQDYSLGQIMSLYVKEIEGSDLVIVIPKSLQDYALAENQIETILLTFGESTTYEMAISSVFDKPIVMWGGNAGIITEAVSNKEV